MRCDYYPTPGYINGELKVHNVTHLDVNEIGSDVAAPIDVLNIFCDTTIGSAANGRDLYVFLDPTKQVVIDGATQPQSQTGGTLNVHTTTLTATGVKALEVDLITGNLVNLAWAYGYYANMNVTAAITATSNVADIFLASPVGDNANVTTYGMYIDAGFDIGLAVLSPIKLSSLIIAPTADPLPYPLDFQLSGWPTAGVYTQGTVINMAYAVARVLDGALTAINVDFNTNVTSAGQIVTGLNVIMPTDLGAGSTGLGLTTSGQQGNGLTITHTGTTGGGMTATGVSMNFVGADGALGTTRGIDINMDGIGTGGTVDAIAVTLDSQQTTGVYMPVTASDADTTVNGIDIRYSNTEIGAGAPMTNTAFGYNVETQMTGGMQVMNYSGSMFRAVATFTTGAAAINVTGQFANLTMIGAGGIRPNVAGSGMAMGYYGDINLGGDCAMIDLASQMSAGVLAAATDLVGVRIAQTGNFTQAASNPNFTGFKVNFSANLGTGGGGHGGNITGLSFAVDSGTINAPLANIRGTHIDLSTATITAATGVFGADITLDPSAFSSRGLNITANTDNIANSKYGIYTTMNETGTTGAMTGIHSYMRTTLNADPANLITYTGSFINAQIDGTTPARDLIGATSGILVNIGANTTHTANFSIVSLTSNAVHDGAAADNLIGIDIANTGNMPQTAANANYYGLRVGFTSTVGTGIGGQGGIIAGMYYAPTGTINAPAALVRGTQIDLTTLTLTSVATVHAHNAILPAAGTTGLNLACNSVNENVTSQMIAYQISANAAAAPVAVTGSIIQGTYTMLQTGVNAITNSQNMFDIAYVMTRDTGGMAWSGSLLNFSVTPTNTPSVYGNKVSQTYGAIVVPNSTAFRGYYLEADATLGTGGPATVETYGVHVDFAGCTGNAAQQIGFYGLNINMPAPGTLWGANVTAAVNLTGNGNIIKLLGDDGLTLTMATAALRAINIVEPATGYAIYIDNAITDVVGTKDLIYADVDCGAITGAAYFRGMYLNIDETVVGNDGSFIVGYQVDMTGFATGRADLIGMNIIIDGSKTGGDSTRGILITSTMTVNNAAEIFRGISVDMGGMTLTAFTEATAHKITLPSTGQAIYIDQATTDAIEKNLIYADIDVAAVTAVAYFRGIYLDIDETVAGNIGSFIVGQQIDITGIAAGKPTLMGLNIMFDGTRTAGRSAFGIFMTPTITLNNGGETLDATRFDFRSMTITNAFEVCGMYQYLASHTSNTAIIIDGQVSQSAKSMVYLNANTADLAGGYCTGFESNICEAAAGTDGSKIVAFKTTLTGFSTGRADIIGTMYVIGGTKNGGDTTYGIYLFSNQTLNNAAEVFYGLYLDMRSMTITSALTVNGIFEKIDANAKCTAIYIDATTDKMAEKDLIYADIDCAAITAATYFRANYFNIDETVAGNQNSFIVGEQIDITGFATGRADLRGVSINFDGTKNQGDITRGVSIVNTMTLNNGSEIYHGIYIEMSNATVTDAGEMWGIKIETDLHKSCGGIMIEGETGQRPKTMLYLNATCGDISDVGASNFFGTQISLTEGVAGTDGSKMVGQYLNMTGFATGRADLLGHYVSFGGTKNGGDTTYMMYLYSGMTLNNVAENFYGIYLDMRSMTITSAAAVNGIFEKIDAKAQCTAIFIDAATDDMAEKNLIFADIDVAAVTGATYFRGLYFDIDETVVGNDGSFIVGQQIDVSGFATGRADLIGLKMVLNGTKSGGDSMMGIQIDVDTVFNNAAEDFTGVKIDLTGATLTAFNSITGTLVDINETTAGNDGKFIIAHNIAVTGITAGRADLIGMKILVDGTKDTGADIIRGIYIDMDLTINFATLVVYGIDIDMVGLTDTAGLVYGTRVLGDASVDIYALWESNSGDAVGPNVRLYHNSATVAVDDDVGIIEFMGRNAANNADLMFGRLLFTVASIGAGTETSSFEVWTLDAGAPNLAFYVDSTGTGFFDNTGAGTALASLFDAYDDPKLAWDMAHKENLPYLASLGLVMKNPMNDRYMIAIQPALQLAFGGIYQIKDIMDKHFETIEERLGKLEKENADLRKELEIIRAKSSDN